MANSYELDIELEDGRILNRFSFDPADLEDMVAEAEAILYGSGVVRSAVYINGDIYVEYEV